MLKEIKPIQKPENLLQLEAFLQRLLKEHPKRFAVEADYNKYKAGYAGEKQLGYELSNLQASSTEYLLLHNIRLHSYSIYYFQMDFILLTRYFAAILDAKHISGNVHFKAMDGVVKHSNGKTEVLKNPIEQVRRHERLLSAFLHRHGFPEDFPVIGRVVYTSPYTTITTSEECRDVLAERVIRAESLFSNLLQFNDTYPREQLSINNFYRMATLIKKHHKPLHENLLKKYDISYTDIVKGVRCPNCFMLPICQPDKYYHWYCHECEKKIKDPFKENLQDYALIRSRTISNHELREFLGISDRFRVRYILNQHAERKNGKTKLARYHLDHLLEK